MEGGAAESEHCDYGGGLSVGVFMHLAVRLWR